MFTSLFALALASVALSAPLRLTPVVRDNTSTSAVTALSNSTVESFHSHALLAQAAYCDDAQAALPQINMLLIGGDGGSLPRFFVGHDPSTNNIVVAHEGTVSDNPFSIAIDANFDQAPLNTTFFPNAPSGAQVHDGFGKTFAVTANEILATVKKGLSDNKADTVLVGGHSLGAALAVMTSVFLKQNLAAVNVSTAVFGLPRGGNQAWADFVDATLPDLRHMHNKHDLVPTVPPRFLEYQHPSGELFVQPDASSTVVFCPGQENENCSEGNDPLEDDIAMHKGPYVGELMGRKACPVAQATA